MRFEQNCSKVVLRPLEKKRKKSIYTFYSRSYTLFLNLNIKKNHEK